MKTAKKPTSTVRQNKWIRKGSEVICTAGNNKGRKGTVLSRTHDKAIVQGLNVRKKHMRRQSENEPGRIAEIEAPIHISNLMLVDSEGNAVKTKVRVSGDEKELVTKKGETLLRKVKQVS